MSGKILVLGATGKTGSLLVKMLAEKGEFVRAATRKPSEASVHLGSNVEVVEFDLQRPETFAPALSGVDRMFLIARPGDPRPHDTAIPFIDEAKKRGVRNVVNLTAMGVERVDDFPLRLVEKHLEASGMTWTHLRPNWFMQNFSTGSMLADIRATGALHLAAGEAKVSFIDVRDIAAVAAEALTQTGHENKAYTLTGGESLDHHQAMSIVSQAAGKTIRYIPLSEEEASKMLSAIGWPSVNIERMMMMFRMVRLGYCAPVSPDVENVLGRAPIAFKQYAKENAAVWK